MQINRVLKILNIYEEVPLSNVLTLYAPMELLLLHKFNNIFPIFAASFSKWLKKHYQISGLGSLRGKRHFERLL